MAHLSPTPSDHLSPVIMTAESQAAMIKYRQLRNEWEGKERARRLARAKEDGFSTLEEYEQYFDEQQELREKESLAWILESWRASGKTREQFEKDYAADEIFDNPIPERNPLLLPLPKLDLCDCEGNVQGDQSYVVLIELITFEHPEHLHPLFCPKSLEDYHSQDVDMLDIYEQRHQIQMDELRVVEGSKSKRLSDEDLVRYRRSEGPEKPAEFPSWIVMDDVVQSIIKANGFSTPAGNTDGRTFRLPSPSSSIFTEDLPGDRILTPISCEAGEIDQLPTLISDHTESYSPEPADVPMVDAHTAEVFTPSPHMGMMEGIEGGICGEIVRKTATPSTAHRTRARTQQTPPRRQSTRIQKRCGARPENLVSHKVRAGANTRIRKPPSSSSAPRTRSRNIRQFFELGRDGSAVITSWPS